MLLFGLAACDTTTPDAPAVEEGLRVALNGQSFARSDAEAVVRPALVNESDSTVYTTACGTFDTSLERWDGLEWVFADIWYGCRLELGPTAIAPGASFELPELPVGGRNGVPSSVRAGRFRFRVRAYASEAHWRAVVQGQGAALTGGPPYTGRSPYYAYSEPFDVVGEP